VLKYMPCSAELATAITLNDDAEVGGQNINIQDAIEGTYVQAPAHDEAPAGVDPSTGEVTQPAPAISDAIALVESGDFDAAADIANGLGGDAVAEVMNAIKTKKGAK